jgi:hypothetical protein
MSLLIQIQPTKHKAEFLFTIIVRLPFREIISHNLSLCNFVYKGKYVSEYKSPSQTHCFS